MNWHRRVSAAAVLVAGIIAFVPASQSAGQGTGDDGIPPIASTALPRATQVSAGNPRRTPIVEAVERVRSAVVNIHSERTVHGPAAEELFSHAPSLNRVNGMGTGIIIDSRGYILTNQHVVDDVNIIHVRLADGTTRDGKVLIRDNESDLALVKIDTDKPLTTMPLGTSSDVMVGETVIAIGNAYGYEHSVTVGIVSAIKRDVSLNKDISYKALIQTDASINPGNSGGPLLNINGELIGVNVAIRAGAQGIGFAIPIDSALRVAADMLSVRRRNNTWHGLVCRDCVGEAPPAVATARPALKTVSNLNGHSGQAMLSSLSRDFGSSRWLVIEQAEADSPAAHAHLQPGDIVLQAAGEKVSCALELERAMLDSPAGKAVPLVIRRQGTELRLDLVLQTLERGLPPSANLVWRKLGMRLGPISPELVSRNHHQLHGGLAVIDINPDSAAAKAGIQRGDILVGLHQWETLTLDNVVFVLSHPDLASFSPLRFFIVRAGQIHRGWLQQID